MKKLIYLFTVLTVLTTCACSKDLEPLKVDYKVTTMQEYEQKAKESRLSARFSDFQISEIGYAVKSVKILCLGEKVFLADITRDALDTSVLAEKYPDYEVDFICANEVDTSKVLIIKEDSTDAEILEKIPECTAYKSESGTTIYPLTDAIKNLSREAPYKNEFIKYLKGTMILG